MFFSLQKLHPIDGQTHNDSQLCEILQVQSVTLRQSSHNKLSLEKHDIDKKLCERCRRFAISSNKSICDRCNQVLKGLNC